VNNKPNEYFIVENRTRLGLDAHCASNGIAVYHCDILGSNEWQGGTADKHYQCALIQSDGARNLENNRNQGDEGDLFKKTEGLALSRDTIPSSRAWGGMESGLKIYNITEPGEIIFFETGSPLEPEGSGEAIVKQSRPSMLIPDNEPQGIWDEIEFVKPGTIKKITLGVDITHTYVRDLRVELESPQGMIIPLFDREGGDGHDIRAAYDSDGVLAGLKGETFAGVWKLHVKDLVKRDIGRLNRWSITVDYQAQKKIVTQEKTEGIAIPDNTPNGVNSTIAVSETGSLTQALVQIELTHSYHGDLAVTLTAPSGKSAPLVRFNTLGSAGGLLSPSFSTPTDPGLTALVGESLKGDWTLNVSDNWEHDSGFLNKWSLELGYEN
jgi:subtilisin-like proprotein convertase family protein